MESEYPAPWNLKGKGYILIYRFKHNFIEEHGRVPDFLEGRFSGGFGSVMLVDYSSSNAGPYGELLFIPGKFRYESKKLNTISKIYVSTTASVVNGRKNWGIPKEKATFSFEVLDNQREHIMITTENGTVAEFVFKSGGIKFPVNTRLLPFPLVQCHEGNHFFTTFSGKGKGQFAKMESIRVNSDLFPNLSLCTPIAVIKVAPFEITFPVPEKLPTYKEATRQL